MEKETETPCYSNAEDMVNQTIWIITPSLTAASEGSNTPILQYSNTPYSLCHGLAKCL